jgi:glycosidase
MPASILSPDVQRVFDQARTPRTRRVAVAGRTVEVATPFPSPADWRDQWIYFLLVDRFCNPRVPPRFAPFDGLHPAFQGGTFAGVREKLDYLRQLGVGALWLSPVLKNCQFNPFTYHGYGIQDFLQVDTRFASDPQAAKANPQLAEDELRALVDEAHARGIYVILDVVLNHAGDVFEYVLRDGRPTAEADWQDIPYTIRWRDENGRGRPDWATPPDHPAPDAAVWPAELRRNELFRRQGRGGEDGGDFASLKELVTGLPETTDEEGFHYPVRKVLIRAYQYLIAKYDVDGFRIDTLKYIEPEFARVFGNAVREFALSIGKKNFFTFGEVYDDEEQIARFIGRHAAEEGDLVGIDAALDFPLFFKLPAVIKGQLAPAEVISLFEHRKAVERDVISTHGEASRYFVTFLDNHDQSARFHFRAPEAPARFADQLTLGLGTLFALQGIPCVYYGTEQGLHGRGDQDLAVREALWGMADAFNRAHPFYAVLERLAETRREQPAMRYGRQYFRPVSGDGIHFGMSTLQNGVLAFSRILDDQELVVLANSDTQSGWTGEVIVDRSLNRVGAQYGLLFSNRTSGRGRAETVIEKSADRVEIHEINGAVTRGPARALRVALEEMELEIWGQIRE